MESSRLCYSSALSPATGFHLRVTRKTYLVSRLGEEFVKEVVSVLDKGRQFIKVEGGSRRSETGVQWDGY